MTAIMVADAETALFFILVSIGPKMLLGRTIAGIMQIYMNWCNVKFHLRQLICIIYVPGACLAVFLAHV